MDKRLQELHAQRASIQKHLEWLDQQIDLQIGQATQQSTEQPSQPEPQSVVEEPKSPHSPATASADQAATDGPAPTIPLATPQPSTGTTDGCVPYVPDPESFKAPQMQSDVQRAKIGCFVLFALSSLLFLFLLFGLPYLLD